MYDNDAPVIVVNVFTNGTTLVNVVIVDPIANLDSIADKRLVIISPFSVSTYNIDPSNDAAIERGVPV